MADQMVAETLARVTLLGLEQEPTPKQWLHKMFTQQGSQDNICGRRNRTVPRKMEG